MNTSLPAPNPERMRAAWEQLSTFRTEGLPGWTRRPFTPAYAAARVWLTEEMRSAHLSPSIDAAGNLIGSRAGTDPALPSIMLGSHTDTVTGGGRFDGIAGVLGAIEVARWLAENRVQLRHTLEVVDFLAEEPTDFGISTVGSRGLAGALDAAMLAGTSPGGGTLAEAIASIGGDPTRIDQARRPPGAIALYLELHVEQGPVLEDAGLTLGVVTAITGITRYHVALAGRPDHAGTMPMPLRRDALAAAAEVILELERLWRGEDGVGTVGRLAVRPNATNVVPGFVELWAEMRSVHTEVLERVSKIFLPQARALAERRGVEMTVDRLSHEQPVSVADRVQEELERVLTALDQEPRRLPSYAGHDGNQMAKITPIGMLFIPSHLGRSHCPEEWTDLEDLALGARALGEAVIRFDRSLA